MDPLIIALLLSIVVGLIFYLVLIPKNTTSFHPNDTEQNKRLKILAALGEEFNSALPKGVGPMGKQQDYPKIRSLLRRSGNPWKLTPQEFVFTQWIAALIGFVVSWPVWLLLRTVINIPAFIIVSLTTILFYFYPKSFYNDKAKKRDLEFKRQLPEALDLMIISLSAGTTFQQALRDSIPNMKDGILKSEFKQVENSIKAGKTLGESLDEFGERAPNESITTFVKAVQEATKLDVPIIEILKARSEASRQEFFALIHNKTAQLNSKMMLALTPTLVPAVLIIAVMPSIISLLSSLGGSGVGAGF